MIGLDTNVLVRLVVDDDPKQTKAARKFVASRCTDSNPGFVNRVSLCELVWVLESVYSYDRSAIGKIIAELLASSDIVVEDQPLAQAALATFRATNVGFADALIGAVNRARGCEATATFDRRSAKLDLFVAVA
jgi:predicted nucleic-acid-binding protein